MLNSFKIYFLFFVIIGSITFAENPKKIENFSLNDLDGKKYSLSDFKSSNAIVIIFISTQCPVSNAYNSRMAKIHNEYKTKKISFISINSNKQENVKEIKEHAKANNFEFTILKDFNNVIADKFEASFTPEVFILNKNFEVIYHGRIDDSRRESDVKVQDLKNTLEEILAGKNISTPETKAFGCTIKRNSK